MVKNNLPEGFIHLFQDRNYLDSMSSSSLYSIVGEEGNFGRRMKLGPVCVEYYTGDMEPKLKPFKGIRFVIWTPVTRVDSPYGWVRLFKESGRAICAFLDIRNIDEYHKHWRDTFKTYYNRFSKQQRYEIVKVTSEVFSRSYKQYAKNNILITMNTNQIKKLSLSNKEVLHSYFLKDIVSGDIVAGFTGFDSHKTQQSFYITAFTRKDIAPKESGLWLCHHWMKESSAQGITYANLGNVWTEGQPQSWKGFSDFKMKFNPLFIRLQPELVRVTFSLK